MDPQNQRESFGSRLGFILVSAGCAIGIGNVWRFPTVTGQYGGGIFVLFYLLFLVLMGLPVLTMELAVGRAGRPALAVGLGTGITLFLLLLCVGLLAYDAAGLERVPYDGYAALLHEGERVLTAREARQADQGGGAQVTITGNTFEVRQESDIDAIAEALYRRLRLAQMGGVR